MHATDLIEGDDPSKLSDDDVDLLAAAYIFCYVSELKYLDEASFIIITKDMIRDFYKIDENKLDKKVRSIKMELSKREFDFMFNLAHNNSYFSELMGFDDIDPWIFEVKVNAKPGLLRKIQKEIVVVNAATDLGTELLKIEEHDGIIYITFSCIEDEDEEFIDLTNLDKLKGFKIRCIYDWTNIFTPSLHYRNTITHQFDIGLQNKNFKSEAELIEYMNSKVGKKIDDITAFHTPLHELMDIYILEKEESLEALEEFMKNHSDYLDVYVAKAGWTIDGEERLALLEAAIELGEEQLSSGIYKDHGPWWYDPNTRPFMLAKFHYANELKWYEYEEEAEEIHWELLSMNPTDNLGIRYFLAFNYLMDRNWKKFIKLRAKFQDEGSLVFDVGDILCSYFMYGKSSKTKKTIIRAAERSPHFFACLLGFEEAEEVEYYNDDYENASDLLTYFLAKSDVFMRYFAICIAKNIDLLDLMEKHYNDNPFSSN
ncbi:hypothetical protein GCM10007940_22370 [Portibacter lacus]|uniref:Uncharacterized protein n=2 Tax=Portibacter lacus TaxID=1099794 RepID=A0AA37WEP1_9BACT|nr:hypothetical protein GCM10007940_22370 [Portibacter lacus]